MYSSIRALASEAMSFSGPGDFGADIVGDLVAGADALDDHQIENIQGDGDITAEDFGELAVVLVEGGLLAAFDVEDADHFVVQRQRHGQAALGLSRPGDVTRIALDIGADIRLARWRRHSR